MTYRNDNSVAAKITKGEYKDLTQKETKELMKISLSWSLPNGETAPDVLLRAVFFTMGGQAICQVSQDSTNGKDVLIYDNNIFEL